MDALTLHRPPPAPHVRRFPLRRGAVALLLLLASALTAAQAAEPAAQATPLSALPYRPVLDVSSMDTKADPCVDFYRFSCGGWQERNPIPADESSWSVYGQLQEENLRFLWGLLLAASEDRPQREAHERLAGDYFAACMAPAEGPSQGDAERLAGWLARIDRLASTREIAPLLADLHALGAGALFGFGAQQDFRDSGSVIAATDAGGRGLPDREHYLATGAREAKLRTAYRAHIARLFELSGSAPDAARAAAATVLAIETTLARASLRPEQRRDPRSVYHRMKLRDLQRLAPAFDWGAYLTASGVDAQTVLNVTEPRFFRTLAQQLARRPLADWKVYLRWHLLQSQSPYLAPDFAQAHFDFYGRTLEGVEAMPARWKQCVRWVDRDLGHALGRLFVEKTFSPSTRERVQAMTQRIEAAMRARIESLDWMSERTKAAALIKLGTVANKIGYPERWRDYAALDVARGDFLGNVQRSLAHENRRQLARIGQPPDRSDWGMTPPTVNAYYDPQMNDINFPAGILQPPLFDPALDDAPNYGNTGSTIGHELTHGFDDEGRQFDAQGNLRDWWKPADAKAFRQRTQCIVNQYSSYPVVDEVRINGRLTLGEDVADLGGTVLAYAAWRAATAGLALEPREGYTPEQRFFIGMAQWACSNDRPEKLRLQAATDPHSPARWRVNGVVVNMPEFARAFACQPGQPMVSPRPCRVW